MSGLDPPVTSAVVIPQRAVVPQGLVIPQGIVIPQRNAGSPVVAVVGRRVSSDDSGQGLSGVSVGAGSVPLAATVGNTPDDSMASLSPESDTSSSVYSPLTEGGKLDFQIEDQIKPVFHGGGGSVVVGGGGGVGSRRPSVLSCCSSTVEPGEVDLSHLNEDERVRIEAVMARARLLDDDFSDAGSMVSGKFG